MFVISNKSKLWTTINWLRGAQSQENRLEYKLSHWLDFLSHAPFLIDYYKVVLWFFTNLLQEASHWLMMSQCLSGVHLLVWSATLQSFKGCIPTWRRHTGAYSMCDITRSVQKQLQLNNKEQIPPPVLRAEESRRGTPGRAGSHGCRGDLGPLQPDRKCIYFINIYFCGTHLLWLAALWEFGLIHSASPHVVQLRWAWTSKHLPDKRE